MPSLCQDSVSTGRVLRDSLLNQPVRLPKTRPLTARSFPSSLEELFKNYHHLRFAVVIHYAHRFYAQDSNRYIPLCMTSTSTICLLPPLSTFHLHPALRPHIFVLRRLKIHHWSLNYPPLALLPRQSKPENTYPKLTLPP